MNPAERHERWLVAMRSGDFETAWRETDALESVRRAGGERQPHHLLWDGSSPESRDVVVRCEHGLGDTLQFSRFLPRLRKSARRLVVDVQEPLRSLFSLQPGIGEIGQPVSPGMLPIEIMELAYVFRATSDSLPPPILGAPGSRGMVRHAAARNVAIFWSASGWGGGRYVPLRAFDSLADAPDSAFFSFQQGPREREAAASRLAPRRMSHQTRNVLELALALSEMNLVISVDTMPAHLAASLGVPVWLLLEAPCDWRWMEGRADSPWYPGMRLYRERKKGEWRAVIEQIHADLHSHEA